MDQLGRIKIALGAAGILLAVLVIVFRSSVGSFFYFGSRNEADGGVERTLGGFTVPSGAPPEQASSLAPGAPRADPASPTGPFPAYQGRDPGEIRPDPKAVAGLGEDQRNELYQAIGEASRMLRGDPIFGQAWLQIGILKKAIGDYEGAADAWEYASIVRQESFVPPANLAQVYWYYLPDYPRAERQFREAIRRDPRQPALYVQLAEFYSFAYRENESQADEVLREGFEANPQNIDIPKALGSVYERRGERGLAIEWWEKALTLKPNDSAIQEKIKELRAKL